MAWIQASSWPSRSWSTRITQWLSAFSGSCLREGTGWRAPQVLSEFVHVVTDARRFQQPFSMESALNKSERWWNAAEADQVLPSDVAIALFHTWMRLHQLGRNRVLDTLLAATYRAVDVRSLLTFNATDFKVFDEFACWPLLALRRG